MFVSVVYDLSGEDSLKAIREILIFYGFKEVLKNVFELDNIKENTLNRLKRDIDRACDTFDKVRFYQFPFEDDFVITALERKKWNRLIYKE